jgi:UDPglucose 6-dehydrogenase
VRITVIGTGYVGLVSGACLADLGHDVTCLDIDVEKIMKLRGGGMPIFEPGLPDMVERTRESGRLEFSSDYAEAIPGSEAVFVAVGTPALPDGTADLSQIDLAIANVAAVADPGTTVVIKSTVPVGTTRRAEGLLLEARPQADLHIASNPEFLRQGSAVEDFMNPDRIVVGTDSEEAEAILRAVYQPQLSQGVPDVFTNVESAELVKYAANAFLATKLSFINEIADLCEMTGATVEDVTRGMSLDDRISDRYLATGPGFGGSCLPKDTQALLHTSRMYGMQSRIVSAAFEVNRKRADRMRAKIETAVEVPLDEARIAVLGLTFKANTDDLRESPSLEIVKRLLDAGADISAYDPQGMDRARSLLPATVDLATSPVEAMQGADAVVIATEWGEFATLDLEEVAATLNGSVLIDLRNLYDPEQVVAAGLHYVSLGRPVVGP